MLINQPTLSQCFPVPSFICWHLWVRNKSSPSSHPNDFKLCIYAITSFMIISNKINNYQCNFTFKTNFKLIFITFSWKKLKNLHYSSKFCVKKLIIFVIFNLYKTKIGFQIKLTSEKKIKKKNNGENNALKFLTRSSTQTNRPLKEARKKNCVAWWGGAI